LPSCPSAKKWGGISASAALPQQLQQLCDICRDLPRHGLANSLLVLRDPDA